jgi:hypothetical protein
MEVTIECLAGTPMMTVVMSEPRGDGGETTVDAVSREVWDELWKDLDAAKWRDLARPCPDRGDFNANITDLELDISDDNLTKKLECSAEYLTSQHGKVIEAFEKALEAANDDRS